MEAFIASLPEVVLVTIMLAVALFLGPAAKNALYAFTVAYHASELRKKLLEGVVFAKSNMRPTRRLLSMCLSLLNNGTQILSLMRLN